MSIQNKSVSVLVPKKHIDSSAERYTMLLVTALIALTPYCVSASSSASAGTSLFTKLQSLLSSLAQEITTISATIQYSSHAQLAAAASVLGSGASSCGTLATNASLSPNQSIVSCNGAYTLIFQGDGNVVLYQTSRIGQSGAPWSTQTNGQTATLFAMQGDGNLVLYNGSTALWGSRSQSGGTYGRAGHLIVGDNGILTVFANDNGAALWSSIPGSVATFSNPVPPPGLPTATSSVDNASVTQSLITFPTNKTGFFTELYACVLGRQPDPLGLASWTGTSLTLPQIYLSWFHSSEYLDRKITDDQFITQLYNCILFRQPDQDGRSAFLQALQGKSMTRDQAVQIAVTSNEFLTDQGPRVSAVTGIPLQLQQRQTVDDLDQNDPWTWLLKSVCVDSHDHVLAGVDPYGGCPAGSMIRKMRIDDPMPYRGEAQTVNLFRDVLAPIRLLDGSTAAVIAFDWQPLNQYNLYAGSDGYDVFGVKDGWVSGFNTQDGGAYGQTFMQANCTLGDGWILFPSTNFLIDGTSSINYMGNHWLQDAQNFPGKCPSMNPYPILTTWKHIKNYSFGGINGTPTKTMDTLVSYDGNEGHVEVFYFTREYGMTRWEAYQPVSQGYAADTNDCSGPATMTYKGVNFTRVACVDPLKIIAPASAVGPVWPVEDINLLQHSHFDTAGDGDWTAGDLVGIWYRGGKSKEGNLINWTWGNSRATSDLRESTTGPSYIGTNCGGTCTGQYVQELYQEIPINKFISNGMYAYGADVRTEGGQGTMMITLQEIDKTNNKVLWQDSFQDTVVKDNGPDQDPDQPNSVYLSSKFISKTVQIPIISGATVMRYYFTPLTSAVTFDILDGWIAPWPQGNPTPYGSL